MRQILDVDARQRGGEGVLGLPERRHHHLAEQRRITADDILRAAGTADDMNGAPLAGSALLSKVVIPALGQAEHAFAAALARINVEDLAHSAAALRKSPGEG